jgi:hypothetical protein
LRKKKINIDPYLRSYIKNGFKVDYRSKCRTENIKFLEKKNGAKPVTLLEKGFLMMHKNLNP